MQIPKIRSRWKHFSGTVYTIIQIANTTIKEHDPDFPIMIVYINEKGNVFAQPIDRFLSGKYQEMRDAD